MEFGTAPLTDVAWEGLRVYVYTGQCCVCVCVCVCTYSRECADGWRVVVVSQTNCESSRVPSSQSSH